MFKWLSKEKTRPAPPREPRPRGILPFLEAGHVIIRKATPHVKNTYEVRLGLFMAVEREHLPFLLALPPGATIAESFREKLTEFGGRIVEETPREYTVYVGAESREGTELDGWVVGDQDALSQLVAAFGSEWPRQDFKPGASFVGEQLVALSNAVARAPLRLVNLDEEHVKEALLALIESARISGGTVYVQ